MSLLQIVWNVDVLEGQTTERVFLDENLKVVGLLLGLFCFKIFTVHAFVLLNQLWKCPLLDTVCVTTGILLDHALVDVFCC